MLSQKNNNTLCFHRGITEIKSKSTQIKELHSSIIKNSNGRPHSDEMRQNCIAASMRLHNQMDADIDFMMFRCTSCS